MNRFWEEPFHFPGTYEKATHGSQSSIIQRPTMDSVMSSSARTTPGPPGGSPRHIFAKEILGEASGIGATQAVISARRYALLPHPPSGRRTEDTLSNADRPAANVSADKRGWTASLRRKSWSDCRKPRTANSLFGKAYWRHERQGHLP